MSKPRIITNKVEFFIGVMGFVSIVYNLWMSLLFADKTPINLFVYIVLLMFSSFFFAWLIKSNINFQMLKLEIKIWNRKKGENFSFKKKND